MPTLIQLEYIVAIDDTKNFSRAAKMKNVSQPSLSAQVQKVEEELDIIIFDRSKKPIKTTEKGLQLVAQAKLAIKEYRKIFDIRNDSGELTGHFHLGIIPSLSSYLLPLFVESFSNKYPGVNLTISEFKTEDLVCHLDDDKIDGGILVTPLHNDKIIERSLFYEKFVAFVSNSHELIDYDEITEKDLDMKSIWLLEQGHCFRDQVIKVCSSDKRNDVLKNINFASGSLETLVNLIRLGKGFTLLPELATIGLSEIELSKNVKRFKDPAPTREVSLVHSRSFLKQDILDAIQAEVISGLPSQVQSLKRGNVKVIDV